MFFRGGRLNALNFGKDTNTGGLLRHTDKSSSASCLKKTVEAYARIFRSFEIILAPRSGWVRSASASSSGGPEAQPSQKRRAILALMQSSGANSHPCRAGLLPEAPKRRSNGEVAWHFLSPQPSNCLQKNLAGAARTAKSGVTRHAHTVSRRRVEGWLLLSQDALSMSTGFWRINGRLGTHVI